MRSCSRAIDGASVDLRCPETLADKSHVGLTGASGRHQGGVGCACSGATSIAAVPAEVKRLPVNRMPLGRCLSL